MATSHYAIHIGWGDCDAAGISFYPNYFAWFDAATWQIFGSAGYGAALLMNQHGIYLPLVEAHARFRRPGFLGDDLMLDSHVAEWRDRFFLVRHVARRGDELVLEGSELRCWAQRHPDDPRRFRGVPIPLEVRRALEGP
jgi:4-hydroxybenzoyl-CoA thioesterase